MELMLPLTGPTPLTFYVVGEVTIEEVLRTNSSASPLKRITARHHALARLLSQADMTQRRAADIMGMSEITVSRLAHDPAFKNLVDFYRKAEDEVFYSTQERLASVTNLALDRIEEKLEDDEVVKKMSPGQLLEIATAGADRTGNGPQQTSVNVNVNANLADRLKAAREKARSTSAPKPDIIDVTPRVAAE